MMPAQNSVNGKMLKELLSDIVAVNPADDCVVSGLTLNSKTATAGDVFFALAGHKQHGLLYAAEAIQRGVNAVVWEADNRQTDVVMLESLSKDVPLIPVVNLKQQLGLIAERFFNEPSRQLYMIGITGTNGKTSCSHYLAQVLNADAKTGVIGTLGNGLVNQLKDATHTTPDAISLHRLLSELKAQQAQNVVMEVSSHGLSQGRVAGIAFDMAVFTNLSRDHLDYHGDMTSYGDAKKLLFEMPSLKTAIINVDDAFGREITDALQGKVDMVRYGVATQHEVEVRASRIRVDKAGLHFDVITPWGSGIVSSGLLGRFNVSNLLAVLSALLSKGIRFEDALLRISKLTNVPGRMQRIRHDRRAAMLVVDYAHTPDALANALQSLRGHIKQKGNLWCVFGCGGDRDQGKRPLMGEVAEQWSDHVIITDDNPRTEAASHIVSQILDGILKQQAVTVIHNRKDAIEYAINHADENDVVLVAGKGHEAYQIIGQEYLPYEGDAAVIERFLAAKQQATGD